MRLLTRRGLVEICTGVAGLPPVPTSNTFEPIDDEVHRDAFKMRAWYRLFTALEQWQSPVVCVHPGHEPAAARSVGLRPADIRCVVAALTHCRTKQTDAHAVATDVKGSSWCSRLQKRVLSDAEPPRLARPLRRYGEAANPQFSAAGLNQRDAGRATFMSDAHISNWTKTRFRSLDSRRRDF